MNQRGHGQEQTMIDAVQAVTNLLDAARQLLAGKSVGEIQPLLPIITTTQSVVAGPNEIQMFASITKRTDAEIAADGTRLIGELWRRAKNGECNGPISTRHQQALYLLLEAIPVILAKAAAVSTTRQTLTIRLSSVLCRMLDDTVDSTAIATELRVISAELEKKRR